jgi:transposase
MTSRPAYPADLSDARWALIEPVLSSWRAARAQAGLGLSEPAHDLREIVNAILYVNRAGCAWQMLPHDFPPYKTVYDYYATWGKDGTAEAIHDLLRRTVRAQAGRSPGPSAALVDAQSVTTSGNVPESSQGIDAGKKIKGRKRHIATGTLGLLLAVLVTAASVQDTPGGRAVVAGLAARRPSVTRTWVDAGYHRSVAQAGAAHGIDVEVVSKDPGHKGFRPLPKRWAVERTYGWLMLHRRLARDYETLPGTVPDHDPLGHDRHHDPAADRRIHPNLA